MFPEILPVKS